MSDVQFENYIYKPMVLMNCKLLYNKWEATYHEIIRFADDAGISYRQSEHLHCGLLVKGFCWKK